MATNDNRPDDLDFGATIRGFAEGQTLFNRYTLAKILGRGGMGVVWLARDGELSEEVALKFLPETVRLDAVALDELKTETRKSRKLSHRNIVRVHDFVSDDHSAAISMEWIDGETLSSLRMDRPGMVFEPGELGPWIKQVCEALDYAHGAAKVIHRDLKPANIMVRRDGEIKIADFGISSSLTESASRVSGKPSTSGTLAYMSPQQALGGRPAVTDDIYSLGATIYELLASKPPFFRGDVYAQVRDVTPTPIKERRREFEIPPGPIPERWQETIAACLEKDAAKRPQSAGEVAWRLGLVESYAAQPKVETAKPEVIRVERETKPTVEQKLDAEPKPKRSQIAMTMLLILLLGCGAFTGWWVWIEQPGREAERQQQAAVEAQRVAAEAERQKELDDAKAKEEKRKAEEALPQALKDYHDGLDYLSGNHAKGVLVDRTKGTALVRKAAAAELPEAEAELAYLLNGRHGPLDNGYLLPDDSEKAPEWAKKAIEHGLEKKAQDGDEYAELEFGKLYEYGLGVPKDYAKAAELYQKAADQGFAPAQHTLGDCYEIGLGVPQDYTKASEWLQKSADQGYSFAQCSLASCYLKGKGVPVNMSKGLDFYQMAADQGLAEAQYFLGEYYGQLDINRAKALLQAAAAQGYQNAKRALDDINATAH